MSASATKSPLSVESGEASTRLLVIIPALNEAATIAEVISRIPSEIAGVGHIEVLVVDDGSTDDTVQLATGAGAAVVSHKMNMGVGKAMQSGLAEAMRRGVDYAVNIDGDGQFAPEDIPKLLAPLVGKRADMVTASRFLDPKLVPDMPAVKRWGNHGMSWLISTLIGERFKDVSCGFRAYSREAILRLVLTGKFTYTQEMFLALTFRGLRIEEIPLEVRGVRQHGKSRVASNLFAYAFKTSRIIFGSLRDYRPALFFGSISAFLLAVGLGLGGFFLVHRIVTGQFSPHLWAGFSSAFMIGLTAIFFVFGQLAAMLDRIRLLQEEQLYFIRKELAEDHRDRT